MWNCLDPLGLWCTVRGTCYAVHQIRCWAWCWFWCRSGVLRVGRRLDCMGERGWFMIEEHPFSPSSPSSFSTLSSPSSPSSSSSSPSSHSSPSSPSSPSPSFYQNPSLLPPQGHCAQEKRSRTKSLWSSHWESFVLHTSIHQTESDFRLKYEKWKKQKEFIQLKSWSHDWFIVYPFPRRKRHLAEEEPKIPGRAHEHHRKLHRRPQRMK